MLATFALFIAQVTNAPAGAPGDLAQPPAPLWAAVFPWVLIIVVFYFLMIRPQMKAKKKQEETVKGARTGDKIVTTSGIHGVITNVKETTVILKISDNAKIEIEKSHIDRVTRDAAVVEADKSAAAKA